MRETKFGEMGSLTLPSQLSNECEIMHFHKIGTPHTHPDVAEIAIMISGYGRVITDEDTYTLHTGEYLRIPAGIAHYMEPAKGTVMHMFIGYETQ